MKEIIFKPRKATAGLFKKLEALKLIKVMRPSQKALKSRTRTGVADTFYNSRALNGAHKLVCVGKRTEKIRFSYHKDNEDFLLIKPKLKYKPLYIIVAREKIKQFPKKRLSTKDFIAIEAKYNDPDTSFFTMLKGTLHAEVTAAGKGQHPVFFVAEPSKLKDNKLKLNINFRINK
jgi:hypothetical protein